MEDVIISYREIRNGFLNPEFNVVKASAESEISVSKIYQLKKEVKEESQIPFCATVSRLPLFKLVGLQQYIGKLETFRED